MYISKFDREKLKLLIRPKKLIWPNTDPYVDETRPLTRFPYYRIYKKISTIVKNEKKLTI
jgi:hypothetical protein